MTVNCVKIGREEESLNIANINLLVKFNKTRQIFFIITRVLSILLTTAATSANVERVSSFHVRFRLPGLRRGELSAEIIQLMSKSL